MASPFQTLSSRLVYENKWLRLREDRIRRPDASEGIYSVVERPHFAVIAPWQDGCLTMVEQFRYPIGARTWELPQGTLEARHSDHVALARAELREETGLRAAQMQEVGRIFQGAGYCNQAGSVFLATDLTQDKTEHDVEEQDMICRTFTLATVEDMVRSGALQDAISIAALGMLRLKGLL
jgi:ADP-ribose pyrophosphatase